MTFHRISRGLHPDWVNERTAPALRPTGRKKSSLTAGVNKSRLGIYLPSPLHFIPWLPLHLRTQQAQVTSRRKHTPTLSTIPIRSDRAPRPDTTSSCRSAPHHQAVLHPILAWRSLSRSIFIHQQDLTRRQHTSNRWRHPLHPAQERSHHPSQYPRKRRA